MTLSVLSLFSGIGAFDLGLERTNGFRTAAFVEIDPFCRRVLAKHWPGVPVYDDVRTLTGARLAADGIVPDVICGGFPCQDISVAGQGAGIEGERSGLWSEFARLIGEIRPRYVLVENVAALLGRASGSPRTARTRWRARDERQIRRWLRGTPIPWQIDEWLESRVRAAERTPPPRKDAAA